TPGAYQTTWNGDPNTVLPDAFVAKIDPSGTQFQYVTYLGGTNADEATGIAIDGGGNAYITGSTRSPDFPTTLGAFRTTIGRGQDGFVAKLNATGTALVYSTFLGADGLSRSNAVGVDGSGNAYIAGQTNGNSLPLAGNTPTSPWDHAFVMKFDASGSSLLFGTWIGGYGPDAATGIAVTGDGTAYVAGYTHSVDGIAAPSTSGGSPYQPLPNGPTFKSTDGGQAFTNVNTAVSTRGSAGFAIDPTDPSTVYQATLDTGVLKTTDGGADWTIHGATPGPTKSIRDVAVNPATPSVLLATSVDNGNIGPIWRSTDGAATWTEVAPFGTFVAFAPSNPFIAYAMHSGGIFKSVDAGATWTQVYAAPSGTPLYSIGVDPGNSDVVYGGQYSGAVLKTANGGASWTSVPLPVPPGTNAQSVVTVAVNPTLSSDVWAGDAIGRIFRSDDGGGTWTFLSNVSLHNPSRMVFDGDTLYISDQGDNRSCATLICFDTTAPFGLVKTSDRGASWSTIMIGGNAIAVRGLAVLSGLVYAGGDINGDAFLERFDTNMGAQALAFGTYLGGGGFDKGVGVALDPSGNPVVAVETHSADFPTTLGASVTNTGVTRFTADGTTLLASSYVGGGGGLSMPTTVAVDADGNAYVAGGGGFNGLDDVAAWIDRVDPSGVDNASIALNGVSSNVGSPATIANGIAAGPTPGDVYVAGTTNTLDFPTTPGAPQPSFASGSSDAFISKVSFADDAPPSVSIIGPADGVTLPRGSAVTITGTTFEQRRPRR
ncbi:MAG TPA: SBBP repeat-containing protein, partial [Vicinamibacterales bacterium]